LSNPLISCSPKNLKNSRNAQVINQNMKIIEKEKIEEEYMLLFRLSRQNLVPQMYPP
jgi:hypothetical protein